VLTEPSAWFLDAMMLIVSDLLVGTIASTLSGSGLVRRAQIGAAAALVGSIVLGGAVGQLAYGAVWGFPLADLVWSFDALDEWEHGRNARSV